MQATPISLFVVKGLPLIEPGDDLVTILADGIRADGIDLQDGDILIIAQKIVSKAEGRYIDLDEITPSEEAHTLAGRCGKDPRHVEVILAESDDIVKVGAHLIIAAHRLGFVMANAGIDESNIAHGDGSGRLLLLPRDPDASAQLIKSALDTAFGVSIGVVINDSFGRPWRKGVVGVALGSAGLPSLVDRAGSADLFGRKLKVTEIAVADELASMGSLLMGQAGEGLPAVLIRGVHIDAPERPASALIRERESDLFR